MVLCGKNWNLRPKGREPSPVNSNDYEKSTRLGALLVEGSGPVPNHFFLL